MSVFCVFLAGLILGIAQAPALPKVSFAEVPVVVATDGHRAVAAHAQDGNKLLRDAAEKNALSWQFGTHEPASFTVTYV
jgi:hypothetical protein